MPTGLSLAFVTQDPQRRNELFAIGLTGLKPLLDKQEVTAVALALEWAVIAANELNLTNDRDKYFQRLQNIQTASSIKAGDKQPLFFNPITKNTCRLQELLDGINQYLQTSTANAATGNQ